MMIIPGGSPLHETRHSRELGRQLDDVVREYQRANPDVTDAEVRTALLRLAPYSYRRRVLAVMVGALMAVAFGVMASTGGGRYAPGTLGWRILGIMAAVAGVTIAAIRFARRA
ncbi:MAG TPA: hypothetical protein VFZ73_15910 [Gemmatimonadaceae bacterium]